MKLRHTCIFLLLLGPWAAVAQTVSEDPKPDLVLEAIREFNRRDSAEPNELTVVLAQAEETPDKEANQEKAMESESTGPLLVTGKAPEDAELSEMKSPPAEAPVTAPEEGLAVRVEKLQTGKQGFDVSKVKLLAPFPAKPLASPPAGWRLDGSEIAPPLNREVELASGSKITLTIRPHLLVPEADGAGVFSISEPGYNSALGYEQAATVGAILSNSILQLDEDSKHLGEAIDRLQQLLVSLPKPEPEAAVVPPAPARKR